MPDPNVLLYSWFFRIQLEFTAVMKEERIGSTNKQQQNFFSLDYEVKNAITPIPRLKLVSFKNSFPLETTTLHIPKGLKRFFWPRAGKQ